MLGCPRAITLLLVIASWLAACGGGPTLTLAASTTLRSRRDGAAHVQLWRTGAELGWSPGERDAQADPALELAPSRWDDDDPRALQPSACAFEVTCRWEIEQREAAYARAGVAAEEEP